MENILVQEAKQREGSAEEVTSDISRLQHLFVNSYLVGEPRSGPWIVVDTGLAKSSARKIVAAAEKRFGRDARPAAIILTHGHFDHVGAAEALARLWEVPVYAHVLELPYLRGESAYPPPDPTVGGGLMARLSRFYPRKPANLGDRVHALPADGTMPGLPEWRWIHTPGHTPGHISLFRERDRTLIAGDAFVTVKQESALAVLTQRQEVSRPPAYFTPDWPAARASVAALANLEPELAATGHGVPMSGIRLRQGLNTLLTEFDRLAVPAHGRYVQQPAVADEHGVVSVPPPVPDPWPKAVGITVAALAVTALVVKRQRARKAHAA